MQKNRILRCKIQNTAGIGYNDRSISITEPVLQRRDVKMIRKTESSYKTSKKIINKYWT